MTTSSGEQVKIKKGSIVCLADGKCEGHFEAMVMKCSEGCQKKKMQAHVIMEGLWRLRFCGLVWFTYLNTKMYLTVYN